MGYLTLINSPSNLGNESDNKGEREGEGEGEREREREREGEGEEIKYFQ